MSRSIRGYAPGEAPARNGLPAATPYVYRGAGRRELSRSQERLLAVLCHGAAALEDLPGVLPGRPGLQNVRDSACELAQQGLVEISFGDRGMLLAITDSGRRRLLGRG